MSLTVWKYEVKPDRFVVEIPRGARILGTEMQDVAVFWALVDPEAPKVPRVFWAVGTGHPVSLDLERATYIGSLGAFSRTIWVHLFDAGEMIPDLKMITGPENDDPSNDIGDPEFGP